jgi:hypothetical protein
MLRTLCLLAVRMTLPCFGSVLLSAAVLMLGASSDPSRAAASSLPATGLSVPAAQPVSKRRASHGKVSPGRGAECAAAARREKARKACTLKKRKGSATKPSVAAKPRVAPTSSASAAPSSAPVPAIAGPPPVEALVVPAPASIPPADVPVDSGTPPAESKPPATPVEPEPPVELKAPIEPIAPVEEPKPPVEEPVQPPVEEAKPPVEEPAPPVEESKPPVEESPPPVEEPAPRPPVEELTQPIEELIPPIEESKPSAEEKANEEKARETKAQEEKAEEERAAALKAEEAKAQEEKAREEKAQEERVKEEAAEKVKAEEELAREEKAREIKVQEEKAEAEKAKEEKAREEKAKEVKAQEEKAREEKVAKEEKAKEESAAPFRFFSPTSFWNEELSAEAPLDPSSAAVVGAFDEEVAKEEASTQQPTINTTAWSVPVYTVPAGQSLVEVTQTFPYGGKVTPALQSAWDAVPLPADALPAVGTDKLLVVWQPSTDKLWEFWHLEKTEAGWQAKWGGAIENVSSDSGAYGPEAWPGAKSNWGAAATSLPIAGGLITLEDLEKGQINHALAMSLPYTRANVYASPAERTDGASTERLSLPEGAHLRLNPNLDLASLHLPKLTLMMAEAAQRYGIFVVNQSANVAMYGQDPIPTGTEPYTGAHGYYEGKPAQQILAAFPWSHLQLLKMELHG